jgi:hypothetical protein
MRRSPSTRGRRTPPTLPRASIGLSLNAKGLGKAIARTAAALRCTSFTLDGEAVVCGPDGVAIFDALHRRGTVSEAMLYAFDLLELEGEDLRGLGLGHRRSPTFTNVQRGPRCAPRSTEHRWSLRRSGTRRKVCDGQSGRNVFGTLARRQIRVASSGCQWDGSNVVPSDLEKNRCRA